MKELLEGLSGLGLVKAYDLASDKPPSDEMIRQIWKDLSKVDPNPRLATFVVYLERNFPEYIIYADYIWGKFPNKAKFGYKD